MIKIHISLVSFSYLFPPGSKICLLLTWESDSSSETVYFACSERLQPQILTQKWPRKKKEVTLNSTVSNKWYDQISKMMLWMRFFFPYSFPFLLPHTSVPTYNKHTSNTPPNTNPNAPKTSPNTPLNRFKQLNHVQNRSSRLSKRDF